MTKAMVVALAMAGCAGMASNPMQHTELAAGHWNGSIDRDGWRRPLYLDIAVESGAWRGEWRSMRERPGMAVKDLEVRGDEVRFDTDALRFIGRLRGDTLSGTVVDLPAGAPAGEFSVTREEPDRLPETWGLRRPLRPADLRTASWHSGAGGRHGESLETDPG